MECECNNTSVATTASFIIEGVIIPLVGGCGILGNLAAVYILRQPEMRSSFNQLLMNLSILDTLFLAMSTWDYSAVKVFHYEPQTYVYMFPYFWYPLKNILMSWTTFLIMGIATERYLAVCRPVVYRDLELSYSSQCRVLTYTLPSLALSLLLNLPKFMEARLTFKTYVEASGDTHVSVHYNATELRVDPDYLYYYIHWTRLLATGVLPFLYLSVMNLLIYCRMRVTPTHAQRTGNNNKKAGNLAYILIAIVLVFIVSNTPRLIVNLFEFAIHASQDTGCFCDPDWWSILISISHLFLTVNSSVNFLIYCSLGEKFKKILYKSAKKLKDSTLSGCDLKESKRCQEAEAQSDAATQDGKEKSCCTETELTDIERREEESLEMDDMLADSDHRLVALPLLAPDCHFLIFPLQQAASQPSLSKETAFGQPRHILMRSKTFSC